jgi:DNA-binding NtrC family response regulator
MHGTILVYGNDEMLVATRRLIFEKADYRVFTADSLSNAMLVLMNHQIDVLVLCQNLSDEERGAVLETAPTLQPEIRFAVLSFDGHDVVTDGVLIHRGLDGPPSLLTAIGRMLGQKTSQLSTNLQKQ